MEWNILCYWIMDIVAVQWIFSMPKKKWNRKFEFICCCLCLVETLFCCTVSDMKQRESHEILTTARVPVHTWDTNTHTAYNVNVPASAKCKHPLEKVSSFNRRAVVVGGKFFAEKISIEKVSVCSFIFRSPYSSRACLLMQILMKLSPFFFQRCANWNIKHRQWCELNVF